MKLQGRIPVEPLDDERLTNIERKLVVAVSDMQAPPERVSRRMLAFAGAAMAMGVAGVIGWKLHRQPAPSTVAVGPDATFKMTSRADSAIAVTRSPGKTEIALAHGSVDLDVKHDPSRLLVIHAGDTDIEDVGTKFSVLFDGKNHVEVRVIEGEVKVAREGKEFAITASNGWTTETGTITLAQLDAASVNVVASGEGPPNGAGEATNGANGTESHGTESHGTDVHGTDSRGSDARGSDAVRAGSGAGSGSAGKHKVYESNVRKAILGVALNPLAGTMSDYTEALKTATDGADKSRLLYSIAVRQHEAKNDSGALHMIEGIVNGRTKDEAYKDAMWLQVRITCLQGLDDKCRLAAQRYLNNIPDGVQSGIAQAILKEIAL